MIYSFTYKYIESAHLFLQQRNSKANEIEVHRKMQNTMDGQKNEARQMYEAVLHKKKR